MDLQLKNGGDDVGVDLLLAGLFSTLVHSY
jgi:hypothetical protein